MGVPWVEITRSPSLIHKQPKAKAVMLRPTFLLQRSCCRAPPPGWSTRFVVHRLSQQSLSFVLKPQSPQLFPVSSIPPLPLHVLPSLLRKHLLDRRLPVPYLVLIIKILNSPHPSALDILRRSPSRHGHNIRSRPTATRSLRVRCRAPAVYRSTSRRLLIVRRCLVELGLRTDSRSLLAKASAGAC